MFLVINFYPTPCLSTLKLTTFHPVSVHVDSTLCLAKTLNCIQWMTDLFDLFGLCRDENLGVASVCEDVVGQVVD